ncbi:MAG: hypothetical protein QM778_28985 [Myxococcales bacterium]
MNKGLSLISVVTALSAVPLAADAQLLRLAGSDSWEPVVRPAFLADPALSANADLGSFLDYAGGGQTPGETALKSTTSNQVIAFFTAQLGDSLCGTYPNAQDIVLAIDGILNVGHPNRFPEGNPTIGTNYGTWQNALSLLYAGYDLRDQTQDCNSAARRALAADYGSLFASSSVPANTQIRHIYRRGEASATAKLFIALLGIPGTNQKWCNGTDAQDLDPIRRYADANDQVAEADGTLGLVLPIVVPTFSNNLPDLYTGANGTSTAAFGKFSGAQGQACSGGPSSIDPSSASLGVPASAYAGLAAGAPATLSNLTRCDCRYPVPAHFENPNSPEARRFNWNVKFGSGCQVPQASTAPAFGVLNGDDGTRDNTPIAWGAKTNTAFNGLPTASRCCNVGVPAAFRRQDPRVHNLFLRDPATGNIKPSATAPALAFYRLATTNRGLSNVGNRPFTTRCTQTLASDLQVACLTTAVPNDLNSIGFGALPVYKDTVAAGVTQPRVFSLNNDPIASDYATIRDRSYALSRYVFVSSLKGFNSLGESAESRTGSSSVYTYQGAPLSGTITPQQQVDAQWNLVKAIYTDSRRPDRANAAVEKRGFLALAPGVDPYAVTCSNDANSPSAPKISLDNATYFAK